MIGIYRPLRNTLSKQALEKANAFHCMGCTSSMIFQDRLSTLFYPYETDLLLTIHYGARSRQKYTAAIQYEKVGCTMFPPLKRTTPLASEKIKFISAAFSNVIIFAVLDDKIRDEKKNYLKVFRNRYLKELPKALNLLNIPNHVPPDPRLLKDIDESSVSTFRQFLDLYDPFVKDLWLAAFKSLGLGFSEQYLARLSKNLSDIMLLVDMIRDFEDDHISGLFNPLRNHEELAQGEAYLKELAIETNLLFHDYAEPYKEILQNILTQGIYSLIHKRRK